MGQLENGSATYWMRASLVAGLLVSIALGDFLRHRQSATRWREYSFWFACGVLGATFALANDLVTSRISHAYFAIGKALPDTDPDAFQRGVVHLALQAGLVAGLLLGGGILLANNPKPGLPRLSYRDLAPFALLPPATAALVAPVGASLAGVDLQGLGPALRSILSEHDVQRFLLVQRIHAGMYLGGLLGTLGAALLVQRKRRKVVA